MADVALQLIVSPFLDVLIDNLTSLISKQFGFLFAVNKDLEKLADTLSTIRLVLEDAEVKLINDKATKNWLTKLKDAAYEADDIIDECALQALQPPQQQVSHSPACFDIKQIMFRHNIGKKIRAVREKIDEVAAQRLKFHLSTGVAESGAQETGSDRETSSLLTEPLIFGRDGETRNIVDTLLGNASSGSTLSICAIAGIGGLGKTTLAQVVYNDARIVDIFDARIWICAYEDFGVKRITKMIVEHLSGKPCELVDLDPMQNYLKRLLHQKKFLLVVDDVWDDDRERWNKLKHILACGDVGSSVIVTTRLQAVVDSIGTLQAVGDTITCVVNPTIILEFLSEQDCWNLFKEHAFGVGSDGNPNLVAIGQEIVRKCGGVPLAVKALGGLLHAKNEEFWRLIRDNEIWSLQEHGEKTILQALRLSFNHLSPLLRQCFAYCSVYPKDYEMRKDTLIQQWMANGFIQSSGTMDMEDIGDEVFSELLRRSFFQVMSEDKNWKEISCKMHHLMHDLACSVMGNECSRMKIGKLYNVPQRARHISVSSDLIHQSTLSTISKSRHTLRTLYFIPGDATLSLKDLSKVSRLQRLRVLYLGGLWSIRSVPLWVGHLKHLRYLNLRNTNIASLPKSVCSLMNLQILVLSYNERFTVLPQSIGNLKNLRCLDLSWTGIRMLPESVCRLTKLQTLLLECDLKKLPTDLRHIKSLRHLKLSPDRAFLSGMPVGIGQLNRLETLTVFVVSHPSTNGSEHAAGIQELGTLNHLKGELTIRGLRHVHDAGEAQEANLGSKVNLLKLNLFWLGGGAEGDIVSLSEEENSIRSKDVLERLHPNPNILNLGIEGYPGVSFPSWLGDISVALPKLVSFSISNMPNAVHILHQFPPYLKTLFIRGCPKLRVSTTTSLPLSIHGLTVERCNDPSLNMVRKLPHLSSLGIGGFNDFNALPEVPLQNLTCLQTLYIFNCKKLRRLPTELENLARTVTSLKIQNCGGLESMRDGLRNLNSLERLKVENCRSLKSLFESPLQLPHLTALDTLEIFGCPELDILGVDFQHLPSLKCITLARMPQLTSLPEMIQAVASLQYLHIEDCKNMRMLPEWLQHLPPTLLAFSVVGCHPELHRRCENDKGQDWHKISHLRVLKEER